MAIWKQVGENLVRHQGGTIYLRAKVAGKIIRRSLETDDLAEALRKTLPQKRPLRKWKEADAREWWASTTKKYSPQRANHLLSTVKRLEIPHIRIHDLRHFFASWCLENCVNIATTAVWLGHKDGGVLLMKTYGHIRDQHSLDSAGKLG